MSNIRLVKNMMVLINNSPKVNKDCYYLLKNEFINKSHQERYLSRIGKNIIAYLPLSERGYKLDNLPLLPECDLVNLPDDFEVEYEIIHADRAPGGFEKIPLIINNIIQGKYIYY